MAGTPNPKGLYCPDCRGVRLVVVAGKRPAPGIKVRYKRCSACGALIKTREFVVRVVSRRPPA